MKKNIAFAVLFSWILGLAVVSSTRPAVAHEGADKVTHGDPATTAAYAASEGTEDAMRDFVLHAEMHLTNDEPISPGEALTRGDALRREAATDGSDWRDGDTYLIIMTTDGQVITHGKRNEARYEGVENQNLFSQPDLVELINNAGDPDSDDPHCTQDETSSRWRCALRFTNALAESQGLKLVVVGGFDHPPLAQPSACNITFPEPETKASKVVDLETLKDFVEGIIETIVKGTQTQTQQSPTAALLSCLGEFREEGGYWKSGRIYFFIMTDQGSVWFNGNDQTLEGLTLDVTDNNGFNVGDEIIKAAEASYDDDPDHRDEGAYVAYLWDDPLNLGDNVTEPGKAPGTSSKISYVQQFRTPNNGPVNIYGSGIYPGTETAGDGDDDGGGCAIASSTSRAEGSPWSAVFNLFLVAFVVFAGVSRKKKHRA